MNGAPLTTRIRPAGGWASLNLREVWAYRDVLWMLALRDIKLRYRQTALGVIWVILQPLLGGALFALIFGRFAGLPSAGQPYIVFVFSGLVSWNLLAGTVQRAGNSLVAEARLITKVYFPRLIIPLAGAISALIDFAVSFLVLIALSVAYGLHPGLRLVMLPLVLIIELMLAIGIGLWISALNVRYRDFAYALPFILQIGMYTSPIVYDLSLVPEKWRLWFELNPMTGIVTGFREVVVGGGQMHVVSAISAVVGAGLVLFGGARFFRRMERNFAEEL